MGGLAANKSVAFVLVQASHKPFPMTATLNRFFDLMDSVLLHDQTNLDSRAQGRFPIGRSQNGPVKLPPQRHKRCKDGVPAYMQ
jgi:hypothetical protein